MARARSRSMSAFHGRVRPGTMSATIASPSSLRGLSSVTSRDPQGALRSRPSADACQDHGRRRSRTRRSVALAMRTYCKQRFFQRVRRVRVVDDGQRLAGSAECFHASRRRAATLERCDRARQRHVQAQQRREHGEQILDIEVTDEPRAQRGCSPAALDVDLEAMRIRGDMSSTQVTSARGSIASAARLKEVTSGGRDVDASSVRPNGSSALMTACCNSGHSNSFAFAAPYASSVP